MTVDPRFEQLLKDKIGLDAITVGASIIERAVRRCMASVPGRDLETFWHDLHHSDAELQALIEAVIVPETWFFRYPESFATLARMATRRAAELAGARPLRLLSLPCSTGEEPYSIAMCLLDAGLAADAFKVDALDISPLSIERATVGRYGRNSFRGETLGFRNRHFSTEANGYRLNESVRKQVRFQVGNLLEPGLLAGEQAYDFVFCRNLLIYFDVATQEQTMDVLKRLTRDDGVLFIGPAEASLFTRLGMQSLGIALSFAFRRQPVNQPPAPVTVAPVVRRPPPLPTPRPVATLPVKPANKKAATPADDSAAQLAQLAALANQGRTAEARRLGDALLARHGPSAEVFYWLGLLCEVENDAAGAQGFYRKALYLQPQHPAALAQLAALLAAQGDTAGAQRLQARAQRGAGRNE
ncbi:CheR family methyltransferase [Pseudomonas turukhanskensis]|uniref:Biofilm formation methyltransferase WspC n=1 Tax=Pseudomonas turukhanskensis TaxID=1806536 RepID=A0A9W6NFW8_9PSED|nr:protein-glutamate O-methyltransferase CheR [Pseudomonas turukhanskensis]GLK89066.1 putative biofilm formation methyltransferase WspC [Pseudomonas turukhanskensis]